MVAPHSGVDDFSGADRGQVAVPLIGEHRLVRVGPLDAGGGSGSPAVGGLDSVAGEVTARKDRTANRAHTDGAVDNAQLLHDLTNQLMYNAMAASRAVV